VFATPIGEEKIVLYRRLVVQTFALDTELV